MRRRIMSEKSKARATIIAGDILCAKADGSKCVFDAADVANISSTDWTPIGVVTIPPSHDVYGTGEGAAISLKLMSCNTPDDGTLSNETIYWGQNNATANNTTYRHCNTIGTAGSQTDDVTISIGVLSYLATQEYTPIGGVTGGIIGGLGNSKFTCVDDNNSIYMCSSNKLVCPSPYYSDGSKNTKYHEDTYGTQINPSRNALISFEGKEFTSNILSKNIRQFDWKTASTISQGNSGSNNDGTASYYFPPFCCSWRYHTIGTEQGDWYIPSSGELCYLAARISDITNTISNIPNTLCPPSTLGSSTETYWNNSTREIYTISLGNNAQINRNYKYTATYYIAYIRF